MTTRKIASGKWAYDFWFAGKRHIKVVGDSKEQAEAAMAVHHKRLQDVKHGIASPITDVRFEALAEEYFKTISQQKRSWRRDRLTLDHLKHFFKGRMVSEIGPKEIESYKQRRLRDVQGPTINRELALLSAFYAYAIRLAHAKPGNPVKGVDRYEENEPVMRVLTAEEEARLLAAASPQTRRILTVLLNTGLRRNELLSLRWKNVDLNRGELTVIKTNAKSKKARIVPLNQPAREALRGLPRDYDLIFRNPTTGRPIHDIKTAFKAACRRAKSDPDDPKDPGITGLRLHDLRHTFATRLDEAGVPITTIMRLLGHSTIAMTLRYAHSSEERERAAVEILEKKPEPERKPERPTTAPEDPRPANYSWN
jgi:integrase